ncbi:MAG: hypothetical protein GWN01_17080, partial [Nitrosopumilaceae archaeon]|nr:hypothetical protein [Nitrosopumilaceae archaeon]NIU02545.1 hypothetical protein [Nitrosopumilaceae archaeon]NIU89002.1 hypothetical protein [Nitrosopumilaceae archaeon]NIX63146.1 hypothetical protein [Nitrosopumilaceae archaeon]
MKSKLILPLIIIILSSPVFSDEPIITTINEIIEDPSYFNFKTVILEGQVFSEPKYTHYRACGYKFEIADGDDRLCVFSFNCPKVERGDLIKIKGEYWGNRHGFRHNWVDISKGGIKILKPITVEGLINNRDWYDKEQVLLKGKVKDLVKAKTSEGQECCTFKFSEGENQVILFYKDNLPIKNNKELIVSGEFLA